MIKHTLFKSISYIHIYIGGIVIQEFIIAMLILICLLLVYIANQVADLLERNVYDDVLLPPLLPVDEIADEHVETAQPIQLHSDEHIKKQEAFDQRIARIKSELAKEDNTERTGYIAEELHDDVKNLPHNTIDEYQGIQDVEYAD